MDYNNAPIEKLRYFMSKQKGELAVVFDIGTKAIRVLITPVDVPTTAEEWFAHDTFFNQSEMPQLGEELLNSDVLSVDNANPALKKIVNFINLYLNELRKANRIKEENISAIGTAVFRWMKNKDEVVNYIKEKTKVTVNILLKKDEALLSLIGVQHTYDFKRVETVPTTKKEAILLIDQGGGSTEISYFMTDNTQETFVDSIDALGTVVLQNHFFTLEDSGRQASASANTTPIPQQFAHLLAYIKEKTDEWQGFDALKKQKDLTIHAYGMGSALPTDSNFRSHNAAFTLEDIADIYKGKLTKAARDFKETRQLYEAVVEEAQQDKRRYREELSAMYGLPVYENLLNRFGIKDIRFAGFGLRYGAFVAKYHLGLDLFALPDAAKRHANPDFKAHEELKEALEQVNKKVDSLAQRIDEARALEKDTGQLKMSLMDAWDERDAIEEKMANR